MKIGVRRLSLAIVFACATLAACTTVGPDYKRPATKIQSAWSTLRGADTPAAAQLDAQWWRRFRDPTLDALIDAALADSPSLQGAAARVAQSQAQLSSDVRSALPQVQGAAGDSYTQPDLKSQMQGKTEGSNLLKVTAQASWEIDFW